MFSGNFLVAREALVFFAICFWEIILYCMQPTLRNISLRQWWFPIFLNLLKHEGNKARSSIASRIFFNKKHTSGNYAEEKLVRLWNCFTNKNFRDTKIRREASRHKVLPMRVSHINNSLVLIYSQSILSSSASQGEREDLPGKYELREMLLEKDILHHPLNSNRQSQAYANSKVKY